MAHVAALFYVYPTGEFMKGINIPLQTYQGFFGPFLRELLRSMQGCLQEQIWQCFVSSLNLPIGTEHRPHLEVDQGPAEFL